MANEQDDLVAILREYEQDMADAIARMDCGEVDNGAMRIIRAERHDTYKRAANRIESQDARIEVLQAEVELLKADIRVMESRLAECHREAMVREQMADRNPLTDEQIDDLIPNYQQGWTRVDHERWIARAVERAHGIGITQENEQ